MIVNIGFRYHINLARILYCQFDTDAGDDMRIIFDNGEVITLQGKELNEFQRYVQVNDVESVKNG